MYLKKLYICTWKILCANIFNYLYMKLIKGK